ncbi:MAG: DUF3524 domain-containing protein [Chloroflexota bacterium]
MKILLLSPYHSGSHKAWAEGYQKYSTHQVEILSLPGQLWKWRMHGAAVTLAQRFWNGDFEPDLIVTDDMLDLPTFIALTRRRLAHVPVSLYMHENQLTYPLPKNKGPMRRNMGVRERQYVLINWKSMLSADHVFFNSHYHRNILLQELPVFLRHYPDNSEEASVERIRAKSSVLPVGIEFSKPPVKTMPNQPPLILWNQRWEFDKNPAEFFAVLRQLKKEGGQFQLAVCGESFQKAPEAFVRAEEEFTDEIVHFGFADRLTYEKILARTDIVISTARHEFFGISVLEAIHAGAMPFLPNRLSYPELIPESMHADVIYENRAELVKRLHLALQKLLTGIHFTPHLKRYVNRFNWEKVVMQYDQEFSALALID